MKKYEEEDIKRIGIRIKSARALTGLNQNELCEKYGLSSGALKSWESGKFAPRTSNLQEFCSCLEQEGIFNATISWFLLAEGPAPTHARQKKFSPLINPEPVIPTDVQGEIDLFKKNQLNMNRKAIVTSVVDDLLSPTFSIGDIVGGTMMSGPPTLTEIQNRPVLVEIKSDHFLIRWCFSDGNNLFFKPQNDSYICSIDWSKLGFILWQRRVI